MSTFECSGLRLPTLQSLQGSSHQERKSSPKSKFWGRISRRRPRGYPGGCPGAKTWVRPSKYLKNKHFGADIHDPEARTSMTSGLKKHRSENFGLNFRCLWGSPPYNPCRILISWFSRKGGYRKLTFARTCFKHNAVFGARFKGLSLYFLYQKGNLIRIKTGLDTCLPWRR